MDLNKIQITGKISEDGQLLISRGEINQFMSKFKGKMITLNLEVHLEKGNKLMMTYYLNEIVEACRKGFETLGEHLLNQDVEKRLRESSPVMWREYHVKGKWKKELKEIDHVSDLEIHTHIQHCIRYAAENLDVVIKEPSNLLSD